MSATSYKPFEVKTRDRLVGIFVIVGLLLFLTGFLLPLIKNLTQQQGMGFYTELAETYGIAVDAKVSLRGLAIGRVSEVAITDGGSVRVDFLLNPDYEDFYRIGSVLKLDTNLAVSTLLTGTGLILYPGPEGGNLLVSGAEIGTESPAQLTDLMDKLGDPQLLDKLFSIVANIEALTEGLVREQVTLYAGLDDMKTITGNIATATAQLPAMVDSAQSSLVQLNKAVNGLAVQMSEEDSSLQQTFNNTAVMTAEANLTLVELRQLIQDSQGLTKQLPLFLATSNTTLQSITRLSDQMSTTWLFGGDDDSEAKPPAPSQGFSSHPHDDALYQR
jgi:ABC-type transporter Mla subunit MlaD